MKTSSENYSAISYQYRLKFHCACVLLLYWFRKWQDGNRWISTDYSAIDTFLNWVSIMYLSLCYLKMHCPDNQAVYAYGKVNYWLCFMVWSIYDYIYMHMNILHLCMHRSLNVTRHNCGRIPSKEHCCRIGRIWNLKCHVPT